MQTPYVPKFIFVSILIASSQLVIKNVLVNKDRLYLCSDLHNFFEMFTTNPLWREQFSKSEVVLRIDEAEFKIFTCLRLLTIYCPARRVMAPVPAGRNCAFQVFFNGVHHETSLVLYGEFLVF